jgi:hypothetical protein
MDRVEWEETLSQKEVTHQLEPGERPTRKRRGVVRQYIWTNDYLPSGKVDSKLQAVIRVEGERVEQVVLMPVKHLLVLPAPVVLPVPEGEEIPADRKLAEPVVVVLAQRPD